MMFNVFQYTFVIPSCNHKCNGLAQFLTGFESQRYIFLFLVPIQACYYHIRFFRLESQQVLESLFLFKLAEIKSWIENVWCPIIAKSLNKFKRSFIYTLSILAVDEGHGSHSSSNFFKKVQHKSIKTHKETTTINTQKLIRIMAIKQNFTSASQKWNWQTNLVNYVPFVLACEEHDPYSTQKHSDICTECDQSSKNCSGEPVTSYSDFQHVSFFQTSIWIEKWSVNSNIIAPCHKSQR